VEAVGQQYDLVFDDFAARLEKEIAIMILPHYGDGFSMDKVRSLSTRLAMLVSRRAREASKIPDFGGATRFCPNCACRSCLLEKTNQEKVC
jgi:NADH pyrophosphatase NudC (nudix superfamily)